MMEIRQTFTVNNFATINNFQILYKIFNIINYLSTTFITHHRTLSCFEIRIRVYDIFILINGLSCSSFVNRQNLLHDSLR